MTTLIGLLVGSHFTPPAKALLEHLPMGTKLTLTRDIENPYDELAVHVLLSDPASIPESQHAELSAKLPGMGFDLIEIMRGEPVVLGHLGASEGKPLAKARLNNPTLVGTREFIEAGLGPATLAFDGAGNVLVKMGTHGRVVNGDANVPA